MAIMDRVRRGEHDLSGLDPVLRPAGRGGPRPRPVPAALAAELRQWLDRLLPSRAVREPDPSPMPHGRRDAGVDHDTTEVVGRAPTRSETAGDRRGPSGRERRPRRRPRPCAPRSPGAGPAPWTEPRPRQTRVLPEDGATEAIREPGAEAPAWAPPPRAGGLERFRAAPSSSRGAAVVGAGVAVAPYVTALVAVVVTWLLRSGSLTGSARRRPSPVRGAKWYDGAAAAARHAVARAGRRPRRCCCS